MTYGERPVERVLRQALAARADEITVRELRRADPPGPHLRRLPGARFRRFTLPLAGLAAAAATVVGYLVLAPQTPPARPEPPAAPPKITGPAPATESGAPSPSSAPSPGVTPTAAPSVSASSHAPSGSPSRSAPPVSPSRSAPPVSPSRSAPPISTPPAAAALPSSSGLLTPSPTPSPSAPKG